MTYEHLTTNWNINHKNNSILLDFLTDDHLNLKTRPKGRTIQDILHHMVKNKFDWLPHLTPKLTYSSQSENMSLNEREELATKWVTDLINREESGQIVKGFKSDLFGFVIYLISHDSHHRGQIFQILKNNNVKIPNSVGFGIWDWKE